jgi:hypothetical protein
VNVRLCKIIFFTYLELFIFFVRHINIVKNIIYVKLCFILAAAQFHYLLGGGFMKKFLVLVLAIMCSIGFPMVAGAHPRFGGPPPPPRHSRPYVNKRLKAQRVLDVTRDVIFQAERVARSYQQAELRRAFSLQKQARYYFSRGHYNTTINYSIRARGIAENIIAEARRHAPPRRVPPHRHHDDSGSSIKVRINI